LWFACFISEAVNMVNTTANNNNGAAPPQLRAAAFVAQRVET